MSKLETNTIDTVSGTANLTIGGANNTGTTTIKTNNTDAVTIDNSQRVGIGTTTPNAELEIKADTPEIRIDSTSASGRNYKIHSDGDELYIEGIGSSGSLQIGEDGTYGVRADFGSGELKFNSGFGSAATAYGVRAWVNFNGKGTPAIRQSGNVSSITDVSTGRYKVNFSNNMPDADYAVTVASQQENNNDSQVHNIEAPNVAYVEFQRRENGTVYDSLYIFVTVTR